MTQRTPPRTLGDVAFDGKYGNQEHQFLVAAVKPELQDNKWSIGLGARTLCAEDDDALAELTQRVIYANQGKDGAYGLFGFAHVALSLSFSDYPEPLLLVTERSAKARLYPGHLSLPGGGAHGMDELMNPWLTASREFQEEVVIGVGRRQFLRLGSDADHTARSMERLGIRGKHISRLPACWHNHASTPEDLLVTSMVDGAGDEMKKGYHRCLVCPDFRTARMELVFLRQLRFPGELSECQIWDAEEHEGSLLHRRVHLVDHDGRSVVAFEQGLQVSAHHRIRMPLLTHDLIATLGHLRQHLPIAESA